MIQRIQQHYTCFRCILRFILYIFLNNKYKATSGDFSFLAGYCEEDKVTVNNFNTRPHMCSAERIISHMDQ